MVDELTHHGVLSVIAAGNNGDLTDTVGSPGNATSALTAASSVDSFQLRDGLKVNGPAGVAGTSPGQMSIAYDWPGNGPTHAPVTGTVVALSPANADGCDPLSVADATAVAGKVAWLTWDSNEEPVDAAPREGLRTSGPRARSARSSPVTSSPSPPGSPAMPSSRCSS